MAGIELQQVFDEKWKNLPQPKQHTYDDDMDAEDDDSKDDIWGQVQSSKCLISLDECSLK